MKNTAKKVYSKKRNDMIAGYAFIAPPLIGFLLFGAIPLVFSAIVSFSKFDFFTQEMTWVGAANYTKAFSDPIFRKSLINVCYALAGLGLQMVVMMCVALLLTVGVKGTILFRALFFVPSLCSSVAVTLVWKWVYNQDFGILNSLLTGMGFPAVGWLSNTKIAMFSMVIQGIWMGIGGGMVMCISALKNVPTQYYEAAKIDGAGAFTRFFKITLPMVSPTTFYILVTSIISTMQDFVRYRMMSDGGPDNATMTPVLYIYKTAFSASFNYDYAYATALAWLTGIIIMVLAGTTFFTSKKWVHYNE